MENLALLLTVIDKRPKKPIAIFREKLRLIDCFLSANLGAIVLFSPALLIAFFCVFYSPDFYKMGLGIFVFMGVICGLIAKDVILNIFASIVCFSYIIGPFMIIDYIWNYYWVQYPQHYSEQNLAAMILFVGLIVFILGGLLMMDYLGRKEIQKEPVSNDNDDYSSPTFSMTLYGGRWG